PGAAALEQSIRQSGRVEERAVDVWLGRVEEDNQVQAVVHVAENAPHAVAHENPSRVTERLELKVRRPGRILCSGPAARPDGEATAPRHGAADRPGANDDALPTGRRRRAPAPCRPGATVRGARASDRDALQRPGARAVQAVVLQEVPRVPSAFGERPGPGG